MREEFILWEKWLSENVRRSAVLDKQDRDKQPPELVDDKKEKEVVLIWSPNMPYGC